MSVDVKEVNLVACPGCDRCLDLEGLRCPYCRLDLGRAAAAIERALMPESGADAMTLERQAAPRLGEFLVQRGLVTAQELDQVLELQQASEAMGRHVFLGELLVEMGFVDGETLDACITEQILLLRLEILANQVFLRQSPHGLPGDSRPARLDADRQIDRLTDFAMAVRHSLYTV